MKKIILFAYTLLVSFTINAQTQLWGTTAFGGASGVDDADGVIFKTDGSGNNQTIEHTFFKKSGAYAASSLMQASDGMLYGLSSGGGFFGKGVLFQFDPVTLAYTKKIDFDGTNGLRPSGSLIQALDGMLYGMTIEGGTNNKGVIFQYNPVTNIYIKKLDFTGATTGYNPYGTLTQASDGMLYGMTMYGGVNGMGILFQYDPITNALTKKFEFDRTVTGGYPNGSLMQATDGMLYGMTCTKVINNTVFAGGSLFQYDPVNSTCTKKIDFTTSTSAPNYNYGSLMQASDGKLYGTNYSGLFQYDVITSTYSLTATSQTLAFNNPLIQASDGQLYGPGYKYNLNTKTVSNISYSMLYGLTKATDGKLYGVGGGGVGGQNMIGSQIIFQYDPSTSVYSKKFDFAYAENGIGSRGSLTQAPNGKLYGMTTYGGTKGGGIIFECDPTTSSFSKKIEFDNVNGSYPERNLLLGKDGILYGMTQWGGVNNKGVLFQYDPNTNTYTKKIDFNGAANGSNPLSSLMQATDGMLYGVTQGGGLNGKGVLFQYNPNTNIYTKKIDFNGTANGANPYGSLMQASDGMLYGMTRGGGANGQGVLFQYNPITDTYTKKIDFNGLSGCRPSGTLIQAWDGMMYGLTDDGGFNNRGVLFQYNPITNTYTKKIDFSVYYGSNPKSSLMQTSEGKLFGTIGVGGTGSGDKGVLFQYEYATNTFIEKQNFSGINGLIPSGNLVEINTTSV